MKAFKLTALREMALLDAPDPMIERPTDVLIKLGAVGVCGSDIHCYTTGPIGRTVLLPAQAEGCEAAYCTDKIDERCGAAERAGAAWVGNPRREDVVASILEREPAGLDIVFECCGQQEALDNALDLLRPGGTLRLIGIPEVDRVSFAPEKMRRQELTIVNVRRQRGCVQAALDLIGERRADIDALVTHRFGFTETKAAFDLVTNYRDGVVKAMIEFD